jgi:hypothetical protein
MTALYTAILGPVNDDLTVDVNTATIAINGETAPLRAFADAAHGDEWLPYALHDAITHLGYKVESNEDAIETTAPVTTFTVVALTDRDRGEHS